MLFLLPLAVVVICGFRRPGFLLPGVLFSFPAASLAGIYSISYAYTGAALLVLGILFLRVRPKIVLTSLDVACLLFMLYAVCSSGWSPDPSTGFRAALSLCAAFGGVYVMGKFSAALLPQEEIARQFAFGMIALALIYGVIIPIMTDVSGARLTLMNEIGSGASIGVTQAFVAAMVVSFIVMIRPSRRPFYRMIICAACLALSANVILLAETRGAFLAVCAGAAFYLLTAAGFRKAVYGLVILSLLLLAAYVIISAFFGIGEILDSRLFNFHGYGSDRSSLERVILFEAAQSIFWDNFLFGAGAGGFASITGADYPHNFFLEIASNFGAVGLLMVAGIAVVLAKTIRRKHLLSGTAAIVVTVIVAGLVHQQVSFSLSMAKPLFLIGMLSGMWPRRIAYGRRYMPPYVRVAHGQAAIM